MSETDSPETFAGVSKCAAGEARRGAVAILSASEASPYDASKPSHSANAPAAIRKAAAAFALQKKQYDFDIDGPFLGLAGDASAVVDCGDVATNREDASGNRRRIEAAVRDVLMAGASPVLIGGDDSVPIPAFGAFEGHGPVTVVQVDAHVDWGDMIKGNPLGYGSTMRRAAEFSWVRNMVQVGIRGLGSGTPDQFDDARSWGSKIVTMRDLRRDGMAAALAHVPAGQDCIITIDMDGLDPAFVPGVGMPTPGGMDYLETLELMRGVAAKARIAGCFIVELVPESDPHGQSALVAARLACSAIGLMRSRGT